MIPACVIGLGGHSGSGKTTLIERALPELKREGLYVGVLKHTSHHSLDLDKGGKDTDRFFGAGADFVFAHDSSQGFARYPCRDESLTEALQRFPRGLDLIFVEGHKDSEICNLWIETEKTNEVRVCHGPVSMVVLYRDDPEYFRMFMDYVHGEMESIHSRRRTKAGLLIGGKSSRMGTSKSLLDIKGETLVGRSLKTLSAVTSRAVLIGAGSLPESLIDIERLPDSEGVEGPLAGILSAFRWDPESAWIISAVDMPLMNTEAWKWLLGQRRPGVWAVLPRLGPDSPAEMTGACYEPMIFDHIESLFRKGVTKLQEISKHPKVTMPVIPEDLAPAWRNVNTPEEWKDL
jgi:molybdopterin-guanine dinucleotide biosynthesis protein A